ncbi:MAG TPA: TSUP family transporter [Actinophytocola sp.]|uniref:TSUP family transporter n=1 Tax=Actinophytocola sp. TaxID=1872138 RepID=UPI002E0A4F1C|nr:TSUP family transporter [Actinophytocola sp.]
MTGTVPGVIIGAVLRVYLLPGAGTFRLLLGPIGVLVLIRRRDAAQPARTRLPARGVTVVAFAAGVVGGIYGIGGGSLLSPVLVAAGLPLARVAPAALVSTFLTSIVGAITYALLALAAPGPVAPDWTAGIACGLGGLLGGYLGARLQPHLPTPHCGCFSAAWRSRSPRPTSCRPADRGRVRAAVAGLTRPSAAPRSGRGVRAVRVERSVDTPGSSAPAWTVPPSLSPLTASMTLAGRV